MNKSLTKFLLLFLLEVYAIIGHSQVLITSTGTLNSFVVSYPANIASLQSGMALTFFSNQSITGSATLTLNTFGPLPILKNVNQPLVAGDILIGQPVSVIFDGSNWQTVSMLVISTTQGLWTQVGSNLQPFSTVGINLLTTTSAFQIGGQEVVRSINDAANGNSLFLGSSGNTTTTGYQNLFVGQNAGQGNSSGYRNVFLGALSGYSNTSGTLNFFGGVQSGYSNTTGNNNVFLGLAAGYSNLIGTNNTFNGFLSGYLNNTGSSNTFVGYYSGYANTSASNNVFIGDQSGRNNSIGTGNSFLGRTAGFSNTTGNSNTYIGFLAGYWNTTSTGNTFLGSRSGFKSGLTQGNNNTFIGANTDANSGGIIGATAIGYNATVGGNNIMALGGTGTDAVSVGIGTGLPQNTLHVVGGARIGILSSPGSNYVLANSNGDLFISSTSGANAWTISGSNIFPANNSNYVGIGTVAPSTQLHILSTNTSLPAFRLQDGTQGVNNVLYSDASGNARWKNQSIGFVANNGAIQNVATTTTGIDFTTVDFDDGSNFNLTTNGFTAPIAGVYAFSWSVTYSGCSNGSYVYTLLTKNGGAVNYCTTIGTGGYSYARGSTLLKLAAGDIISLTFYSSVAAGTVQAGTGFTYLSGFLAY